MTQVDLDRLEAAHAATTPGEWEIYGEPEVGLPYSLFVLEGPLSRRPLEPLETQDAHFIALAHNELPALIAENRQLRAENAAMREALGWYATMFCEGIGDVVGDFCGKCPDDQCAGCKAHTALEKSNG